MKRRRILAEIFGQIGGRLVVGLGFGAKNSNKNMEACDRPWRPPPSYGRYGAARPATKHATINLYHMRWEKILIIAINLTIIARRVDDDVRRRRIDDETMGAARRPPPPATNHTTIN